MTRCGSLAALVLAASLAAPAFAEPIAVAIDASIGSTYDSNLFRLSPVEERAGGFPSIDDIATTPRGAVELRLPFGLQSLHLAAAAGYRFYRSNTSLDSFDYAATARLAYRLPFNCSGTLHAGQEQRLSNYEDFLGKPRRVLTRDRIAAIDAICDVTPDIALAGSAEYRTHANSDENLSALDLDQTTIRAEASYGLPETVEPYAVLRYRDRAQPNFLASGLPGGAQATIWDAGGGVRWSPSEYLKLDAAGYWTRLRENSRVRDATLFSGELTVDWEITGKTSLHLTAETGVNISPTIAAIAYKSSGVGLRAVWAATPKLQAELGVGYRRRAVARNLAIVEDAPVIRNERDDTWRLDAGARYRITDALLARAGIGYRDRRANFEDLTFKAAVATIGLTYRFAGPALDVPAE